MTSAVAIAVSVAPSTLQLLELTWGSRAVRPAAMPSAVAAAVALIDVLHHLGLGGLSCDGRLVVSRALALTVAVPVAVAVALAAALALAALTLALAAALALTLAAALTIALAVAVTPSAVLLFQLPWRSRPVGPLAPRGTLAALLPRWIADRHGHHETDPAKRQQQSQSAGQLSQILRRGGPS